jgi:hypothetical protein
LKVEDWEHSLARGALAVARFVEFFELRLDAAQVFQAFARLVELFFGLALNLAVGRAGPRAQPKQLLDGVEGKAQLLGALDEVEASHRAGVVLAVAVPVAGRLRQKAPPLVVAHRLPAHARAAGHVAGRKRRGVGIRRRIL